MNNGIISFLVLFFICFLKSIYDSKMKKYFIEKGKLISSVSLRCIVYKKFHGQEGVSDYNTYLKYTKSNANINIKNTIFEKDKLCINDKYYYFLARKNDEIIIYEQTYKINNKTIIIYENNDFPYECISKESYKDTITGIIFFIGFILEYFGLWWLLDLITKTI